MSEIQRIRTTVERFLIPYLWLHVPLVAAVSGLLGKGWILTAVGALVMAGTATATWKTSPGSESSRQTIGVALVGMVMLLVYGLDGHPWQIDMHMYFFAALAMLTAFCDWKVLIVSAAMVALHHLLLNFVYPAAVFPDGAAFGRVVLHAVIVVVQVAVLSWVAWRLNEAFAGAAKAVTEVQVAHAAANAAANERDRLSAASQDSKREEMRKLAEQFQAAVGDIAAALSRSAGESRGSAQDVNSRLTEISGSLTVAADSAQEVTGNVETVAAAAEELSASVQEVNRFIEQSSAMAVSAVRDVEKTRPCQSGMLKI